MALAARRDFTSSSVLKVAGAVVTSLAAFAALFHFAGPIRESVARYQAARIVRSSTNPIRSTEGRLMGAGYAAFPSTEKPDSTLGSLGRAQLAVLGLQDSPLRVRLQSQIDIAAGYWQKALANLSRLSIDRPKDAALLNDIGVLYLQLAPANPIYWIDALDQFDKASAAQPNAPEPKYNLVLLFRKLNLSEAEKTAFGDYSSLERNGSWFDELNRKAPDEDSVAAQLQGALDKNDLKSAKQLVWDSPQLCRKIAMSYAMNPTDSNDSAHLIRFVGEALRSRFDDYTIEFMLEPLDGPNRTNIISARQAVIQGADFYSKAETKQSLESYDKADIYLKGQDSVFDQLWVDLNRADSEIRNARVDLAKAALDRVVIQAKRFKLKWLAAMAESPYGSNSQLNDSYEDMLSMLQDAASTFEEIGGGTDSARALYYLATRLRSAGDLDGSLKSATQGLQLADPTDNLQLSSLHWLLSSVLYEKGYAAQAAMFSAEAVNRADKIHNPLILSATSADSAWLYEKNHQPLKSDQYLARSEAAADRLQTGSLERMRADLYLNVLKGEIYLDLGRLTDAEKALKQNLDIVMTFPFPITEELSRSLRMLGDVYANTDRIDEARAAFYQAVDVVEADTQFLRTQRLQVVFEDERRKLYDSAIAFEYSQRKTDDAWTYVQRYRAKLFLEFLAQFNPTIEKVHTKVIDRNQVQSLIPPELQIVEYVMLQDRLLIWYVTNKTFETRTVSIGRADLDQKVQDFLAGLRAQKPMDKEAADLYGILISPLDNLLVRDQPLAIIPDLALHGLPFAALRCPGNGDFLIQRYPVLESPSLTHLLSPSATPKRDTMVSFGSLSDDPSETRELDELRGLYRQVTTFSGAEVTKAKFLAGMAQAPVFHYAGHSAHDAVDPLRSSILLDGNVYGPNSVTAVDIAEHRLQPNSVVVLSSCDSSVGNSKDGIGMRGLTSAFLIGGAGSVVGSLWQVDSKSTSELMIDFHKAFAGKRIPVAQALRKAQMEFIEANPKLSSPFYWAGFVVTGNFSAIR